MRLKYILLFMGILTATLAVQSFQSPKAHAFPNNCSRTTPFNGYGTLCSWNAAAGNPYPPQVVYDSPVLLRNGNDESGTTPDIPGNSNQTFTIGYNSAEPSYTQEPHIATWLNIGGHFFDSISAPGGVSSLTNCFDEVMGNSSPYFDLGWPNPGYHGKYFCDGATLSASGCIDSGCSVPGDGESAVFINNADGPGLHNARYNVNVHVANVAVPTRVCLRMHTSVSFYDPVSQGVWGNTYNDYLKIAQYVLGDVKATQGTGGANGGGTQCYTIQPPTTCTPGVPPCSSGGGPPPTTNITCNGVTIEPPTDPSTQIEADITGTSLGGGSYHKTEHHNAAIWSVSFTPYAQSVSMTFYNRHHNTDGTPTNGASRTISAGPCYSGSCHITSVGYPGSPGNFAVSGGQVSFTVQVVNNGPLPLYDPLNGHQLALDGTGGSWATGFGLPAPPGAYVRDDVITMPVSSLDAPGPTTNPTYDSADFALVYHGGFGVSAPCGRIPVNVYQHFNIVPHANIPGTTEDPVKNKVTYTTGGTKTEGPDVAVTDVSSLTYQPPGGGVSRVDGFHSTARTYGAPVDETFVYSPASATAGERYCANVTISPANGWVGQGGPTDIVGGADASVSPPPCELTNNEPYVHFFGSDASAGGGFGDSCTTSPSGIKTYLDTTGVSPVGSGVQIGALSIGPINGFSSAILRGTAPTGSTGLTFANAGVTAGAGPGAPAAGGSLGGTSCVPDYFGKMPPGLTPQTNTDITVTGAPGSNASYYTPAGGTLSIHGGLVGNSTNIAIYVKGNVYIDAPITYATSDWSATGIESIPSVYIIAEGGNVYLAPSVTQLDGVYISQPDSSNIGGSIYTCSKSTIPYSGYLVSDDILSACRRQLLVNGAFVAKKVFLDRSFGSLRNSSSGEHYTSGAIKSCGDSGSTVYGDCSAEIFNFSPEIYLQQPATVETTGPSTGTYDYITSLSPVL